MGRMTGKHDKTYVIAEIGNNHNGDFGRAVELIEAATFAGVDCIKFQMRSLDKLYRRKTLAMEENDLATEYVLDLLDKYSLSVTEHKELKALVESKKLDYMCTPWESESVNVLEDFGVERYKIASADFTNLELVKKVLATGKPTFISCGMASMDEICKILDVLEKYENEISILHCNSTYPAPHKDLDLNFISTLNKMTKHKVGYSGHERGIACSIAAVAIGAKVIERHITTDRSLEGPDHAASLLPDEFRLLVKSLREVEQAMGHGSERHITQGEMINRENLGKSLVAARPLYQGRVVSREDVDVKSPGTGLAPIFLSELIGVRLNRKMQAEDFFRQSDLEGGEPIKFENITFSRPVGVPVRFHDLEVIAEKFDEFVSLYEFHLSYKDLHLPIPANSRLYEGKGFVVHAPELFEDSALLDLCSSDEQYRRNSVSNMQRTIDITRNLWTLFPFEASPRIVTNIGGFSADRFLSDEEIEEKYDNFGKSLRELDTEGINLIPQTMAPFPWHFGGQRYQNIMMTSADVSRVRREYGLEVCLDISHTQLYCNVFNQDILSFIREVGENVSHLHISDTDGENGEGLQIGTGTSDLASIMIELDLACPDASFIPEVWQGHKNEGEGFVTALNELNKLAR